MVQGLGRPSYQVAGYKSDLFGIRNLFQVIVMIPRFGSHLGPWATSREEAVQAAASSTRAKINCLQRPQFTDNMVDTTRAPPMHLSTTLEELLSSLTIPAEPRRGSVYQID